MVELAPNLPDLTCCCANGWIGNDSCRSYGVSTTANTRDLKRAYLRLALKTHPDKHAGKVAARIIGHTAHHSTPQRPPPHTHTCVWTHKHTKTIQNRRTSMNAEESPRILSVFGGSQRTPRFSKLSEIVRNGFWSLEKAESPKSFYSIVNI